MGGCASKPNEADGLNPENPSPKSTAAHELTTKLPDDGDAPAEVKTEKAEELLVDVSTPKVDEDNSSTTVNAEEIAAEIKELKTESAKPTGSVTEEAEKEEKAEVDKVAAKETDKEEEIVDQPLAT